jgi:hypothetical protein
MTHNIPLFLIENRVLVITVAFLTATVGYLVIDKTTSGDEHLLITPAPAICHAQAQNIAETLETNVAWLGPQDLDEHRYLLGGNDLQPPMIMTCTAQGEVFFEEALPKQSCTGYGSE